MNKKLYFHITVEQRYKIESLVKAGICKKNIADQLGLHKSTLYRELNRNKHKSGKYQAVYAEEVSRERKERFAKYRRLTPRTQRYIEEKLTNEQWSPEQIHGYCKTNNIHMVSHERIYQLIYQDKAQGGVLYNHLRHASKKYRKRYGSYDKRGVIPDRVSIDLRPQIVNDRKRIGDWEVDTIIGKNHKGAVLTVVERKSLFTLIAKLDGKKALSVKKEIINLMAPFKKNVFTITSDNGTEFTEHKQIANKLNADFFFAHPYSSWERGRNENTNGLIRQYIPKKQTVENIDHLKILEIMRKLNTRPRKTLEYKTPLQVFMTIFENPVAIAS